MSQRRANAQGERRQTKYLLGTNEEFASTEHRLCVLGFVSPSYSWSCGSPLEAGAIVPLCLQENDAPMAPQQGSSGAGMRTHLAWFQSACSFHKSIRFTQSKIQPRWKVEWWTMSPSSIYRQRTNPDRPEGKSTKKGKLFWVLREDILRSQNGDSTRK